MEDQLMKILKSFKSIIPEQGYVERSKKVIISHQQNAARPAFGWSNVLESFKLGAALTLASGLLFIVLGGLSMFNIRNMAPVLLTSVNDENISVEASNLDFQIQLGEAAYHFDSDKEVGAKIDELLNNLSL